MSLLLTAVNLNIYHAKRYFLWRVRHRKGYRFFSLLIPKSQNNYSCVSSWLEKLGKWHWFISNHNSDLIAISETNRINEESNELSQRSLAIIQLEETVQTPKNSLNASSAFDSDAQVSQSKQDLLMFFPCACCLLSHCKSQINCTPVQIWVCSSYCCWRSPVMEGFELPLATDSSWISSTIFTHQVFLIKGGMRQKTFFLLKNISVSYRGFRTGCFSVQTLKVANFFHMERCFSLRKFFAWHSKCLKPG